MEDLSVQVYLSNDLTIHYLILVIPGSVQADANDISCNSLKLQGAVASGIYTLKKDNEDARLGYCDMSVNGYLEADLEVPIGYLEAFASPGRTMFSVYRTTSGGFSGDVTYNNAVENTYGYVNLDTGIFTSPTNGIFHFTFSAEAYSSSKTRRYVGVYINGNRQFIILADNDTSKVSNLNYSWYFELKTNDQVQLKIDEGNLYSSSERRVYFNGYLVKA